MNTHVFKEDIPIINGYEVIVAGGGIAGISAALSAARMGCKTLLVEKLCNAGGLATGGFISYYLPLCDGLGKVVSRGIAEELFLLATETAPGKIKGNVTVNKPLSGSRDRIQSYFYPAVLQTVIDSLLEENGVQILFDATVDTPVMKDRGCEGVIINRREGRAYYTARSFVDATGDAAIMHRAGAETVDGENMLSWWYYTLSEDGYYQLCTSGADAHEAFNSIETGSGSSFYRGLTSEDISRYIKDVKRSIWRAEGAAVKSGKKIISALPSVPQLRCHRRIIGREELSADEKNIFCKTSIGCASDWRGSGIVYEVPFGILFSKTINNIITAGRTVSATGDAYEVMRCIPQCAVTGQAAGTAAALMSVNNIEDFVTMEISPLQKELEGNGVLLHYR